MISRPTEAGTPVGYGLIGAGRFGRYAAGHYAGLDPIRLVAVADAEPERAREAAEALNIEPSESPAALLARDDIELVHVAVPPDGHATAVRQALEAGKHVLCEKPLATDLAEAELLMDLAHERGLVLGINQVMRYTPLGELVKQIVDDKLLGEPIHGWFENEAQDETIEPGHWFWSPQRSGGIFIEHGVHFFDLFSWWLGTGEVACAAQHVRPGTQMIDQVQCLMRYEGAVPVTFYHGFVRPSRLERQELRLAFDRGTVRLFGWLATRLELDAVLDEPARTALEAVLPTDTSWRELEQYEGAQSELPLRHRPARATGRYAAHATAGMDKEQTYGHVLRELICDQVAAIRDPNHSRRVTELTGYEALHTAVTADQFARHPYHSAGQQGVSR